MRSGPCVCIPSVRQGAGRGGRTDTCRSCRFHRRSRVRCISLAIRARFCLIADFVFSLLTSRLQLKTPLSDVSRFATEGTSWSRFLGPVRGCSSGGSSSRCSSSSGRSSNSGFMCLLILKCILNLLHCQIGLCEQGGCQSRVFRALE